jgi:hypothetical protein
MSSKKHVLINGTKCKVDNPVTYDDLVWFAFGKAPSGESVTYAIRRAPGDILTGPIAPDGSCFVINGSRFTVTQTADESLNKSVGDTRLRVPGVPEERGFE